MNSCENKNVSVTNVFLNKNFVTLVVGEELELEVFIRPEDAKNKAVTWASNKEGIVIVFAEGVVKAEAEGIAVVTVTSVDGGKTADCVVTVRAETVISEPEHNSVIISGIMPHYRVLDEFLVDPTFLSIPDQINFLGIYPTLDGEWQFWRNSMTPQIHRLRSLMRPEQKLVVVGGGGGALPTQGMHAMGSDPAKRDAYTTALVNLAHEFNFDGIAINWETDWSVTPPKRAVPADYIDLFRLAREKIEALPENTTVKRLSSTLDGSERASWESLAPGVQQYVDYIDVDVYDVYPGGAHAPLSALTTALQRFSDAGIPKNKLLAGVPFYGGQGTTYPQKSYREIYNDAAGALTTSMNSWDGWQFNGVNLIRQKTQYVINNGYGGMKIFELTFDIPYDNELSLLRVMRKTIDEVNN